MSQRRTSDKASRREFLAATAAATIITVLPSRLLGADAPSNTLNVAKIGCGGMGGGDLDKVAECGANIVALCDVDTNELNGPRQRFPNAKCYQDFRKMFDEMPKDIDAAVVSTADVTHAIASMWAMERGKHVYCQKPLTRTVKEARLITEAASKHKVVTQMGNQGHGGGGLPATAEYIRAGAIGTVREVHVWSDRPRGWWPQPVSRPKYTDPIPKNLNWDLWLGPMPNRPFVATWREGPDKGKPVYHRHNWRGWFDFGAGAVGDMACHNMDPAFFCLELGAPTSVKATCPPFDKESFPAWAIMEWVFPATDKRPAVRVFWYEGGKLPGRPEELEPDRKMGDNGCLFIGDKGKMMGGGWADFCRIIPEAKMKEFPRPPETLPRSIGHYKEWVEAAKGAKIVPGSNFAYSGPMTEAILLGNIAVRYPGEELKWDAKGLRFTNKRAANRLLHYKPRKGWEL
jgi:predicted dehydrogenase